MSRKQLFHTWYPWPSIVVWFLVVGASCNRRVCNPIQQTSFAALHGVDTAQVWLSHAEQTEELWTEEDTLFIPQLIATEWKIDSVKVETGTQTIPIVRHRLLRKQSYKKDICEVNAEQQLSRQQSAQREVLPNKIRSHTPTQTETTSLKNRFAALAMILVISLLVALGVKYNLIRSLFQKWWSPMGRRGE